MKKLILGFVVLIMVITISLLVTGINRKIQKQKEISEKISRLPSFSFKGLGGTSFESSDIKQGPVLIVHFHPECEHCQYEISEILKSEVPQSFKNVLLVSSAHPDSIRRFLERLDSSEFPSIVPLADTSYSFEDTFGRNPIPCSFIYNRKLNLVKILPGEVKTETILKYLRESEQNF
jgi:hypothetical protein